MIYLDMDDVVADFTGYASKVVGYDCRELGLYKYPDHDWEMLSENQRIYRDLKLLDGAISFVEACGQYDKVAFLTAVPSGDDVPYAYQDKLQWAAKYFPGIPVFFGPYSKDKVNFAKVDNILVDDRKKNIDAWRSKEGIGVWFEGDYIETLEEIKKWY
jgi:5'(3')-deoxyribonucleotidase